MFLFRTNDILLRWVEVQGRVQDDLGIFNIR